MKSSICIVSRLSVYEYKELVDPLTCRSQSYITYMGRHVTGSDTSSLHSLTALKAPHLLANPSPQPRKFYQLPILATHESKLPILRINNRTLTTPSKLEVVDKVDGASVCRGRSMDCVCSTILTIHCHSARAIVVRPKEFY